MKTVIKMMKHHPEFLFDRMTREGWQLSKDELLNICKELLYALMKANEDHDITDWDYRKIMQNAAEWLEETYDEES